MQQPAGASFTHPSVAISTAAAAAAAAAARAQSQRDTAVCDAPASDV